MSKSDNIYNALDYARNKLRSATEAKGAIVSSLTVSWTLPQLCRP